MQPPADLIQFGLAPEDEIDQIIELAKERGFKRAAVVTPVGENYTRLRARFQTRWEETGGSVVTRSVFGPEEDFSSVVKNLLAIDAIVLPIVLTLCCLLYCLLDCLLHCLLYFDPSVSCSAGLCFRES